jgi:glutaconate CoA-transferase subunit B
MACVFARALRDGDTLVMGTNASIPASAWQLAHACGKPRVRALIGATGTLDPTVAKVPASGADQAFLQGRAELGLARGVADQLRGFADVIFLGGLQVDARGRLNLCSVGDYASPRLRGPGSIGLSLVATIPRVFMFFERHDPRVFVESVDFVSGDVPAGGGELLIVTPLAVLGFAAGARRVALHCLHQGITFDEVQQATGFTLAREYAVTTPAPSAAELTAIARCAEARALG